MKRHDVTGSSGDSKLLRRATKNVMLLIKDYLQAIFWNRPSPARVCWFVVVALYDILHFCQRLFLGEILNFN
jgi:hypothetical protein